MLEYAYFLEIHYEDLEQFIKSMDFERCYSVRQISRFDLEGFQALKLWKPIEGGMKNKNITQDQIWMWLTNLCI